MNVVRLGATAEANWKSSITITTGSPSAARSFTVTDRDVAELGFRLGEQVGRVEPAVGPPASKRDGERGPKSGRIGIALVA